MALRITPDLPDDSVIETWFAEPVRLLLIPSDTFLTNRNAYSPTPNSSTTFACFTSLLYSYPVLSRRHQNVIRKFFQLPGMRVLLTGRPRHRLNWEP